MLVLTFDGSFEGFLTVVFECYEKKLEPYNICPVKHFQEVLFAEVEYIEADKEKAERVWKGLQKKLSKNGRELPYRIFLSEDSDAYLKLYRFIRRVFDTQFNIETDYGDSDVLELKKLERKVTQEAMRMLQFVRFQKTKDDIYFASIEPECNVIPLIVDHFKSRFSDQQWLIYDFKREYGIFYNLYNVEEVVIEDKAFDSLNGKVNSNLLQESEVSYQKLWKDYFENINIKERKNLKVQRQHMPQRYWKFLPEKDELL